MTTTQARIEAIAANHGPLRNVLRHVRDTLGDIEPADRVDPRLGEALAPLVELNRELGEFVAGAD
jgi:hypothetical protein